MKKMIALLILGCTYQVFPAFALDIQCESEGPMLSGERLRKFIGPKIAGAAAEIPDTAQGGRQRLQVRLRSKYFEDDESYLYLVDFELQQQVVDGETRRIWWPAEERWATWGSVPSEAELRKNIDDLIQNKVNRWTPR